MSAFVFSPNLSAQSGDLDFQGFVDFIDFYSLPFSMIRFFSESD